jgi:hypothetical protein
LAGAKIKADFEANCPGGEMADASDLKFQKHERELIV